MKASTIALPILALGLGGFMTSCVDPYYSGATHTTVTHTEYRPGHVVRTLPPRYETETIGGVRYYYHDNVYYRPQGNRYVVVEAPRGSRRWDDRRGPGRPVYGSPPRDGSDDQDPRIVRTLPRGVRTFTHRGTTYYRYGDRFYRRQGDVYVVVQSPF